MQLCDATEEEPDALELIRRKVGRSQGIATAAIRKGATTIYNEDSQRVY